MFVIHSLHFSPLNRSLHRQHAAECTGGGELLQTPVSHCCPGRTGQRANDADLPHGLHAAAPPGPPVRAAPAVRQTAELGRQHSGSRHVELQRNSPGLLPRRFPAAWNDGASGWMHNFRISCKLVPKFQAFLRLEEVCNDRS